MVDTTILKEHLDDGAGWSKLETDIPGVFIVKIPATKTRGGRLMVELNPVNPATGLPKKRKGLLVADYEMLIQFLDMISDDRVADLVKVLGDVNPKTAKTKKKVIKL